MNVRSRKCRSVEERNVTIRVRRKKRFCRKPSQFNKSKMREKQKVEGEVASSYHVSVKHKMSIEEVREKMCKDLLSDTVFNKGLVHY